MKLSIKKKLYIILFGLFLFIGCICPLGLSSQAKNKIPGYEKDFTSRLGGRVYKYDGVERDQTLRQNVINLFYPKTEKGDSAIYQIIRDIALGVMIIFIVWAGASLLLNKKPEESRKHLYSLLYILLGGIFIYGANRLFGDVFKFSGDSFTTGEAGLEGFTDSLIGKVFFFVLSAAKAAAFFVAIIMIVITGFRVMAAGEGEKGKKLVKGLINVVVALLVIKGIDFIYYLAADSNNFVQKASDFIINIAKIFGRLYGIVTVIMVIVAGYLYITDGGSGSNFKKASNILVNILLSALVLFSFLLITYQIFAEFQTGGDAVTESTASPTAFLMVNQNYV